jgi:hypothetical protein
MSCVGATFTTSFDWLVEHGSIPERRRCPALPQRGALDVIYATAPYTVMQRAVNIHPTLSELIPTMLGELKPL